MHVAASDKEKACTAIERHLISENWQATERLELEWSNELEGSRKGTAEDHRYELMRHSVEAETEPSEADEFKKITRSMGLCCMTLNRWIPQVNRREETARIGNVISRSYQLDQSGEPKYRGHIPVAAPAIH